MRHRHKILSHKFENKHQNESDAFWKQALWSNEAKMSLNKVFKTVPHKSGYHSGYGFFETRGRENTLPVKEE